MSADHFVHEDLAAAWTLPASTYTSPQLYHQQLQRIFRRTWHFTPVRVDPPRGHAQPGWPLHVHAPQHFAAYTLLEGSLHVPLVFTRDAGGALHALSNVCTHRGYQLMEGCGSKKKLVCAYHGARFNLNGHFDGMPEMDRPCPDLPAVSWGTLGPFVFASVDPAMSCHDWLAPVRERVGFLPLDAFHFHALGPTFNGAWDPVQHNHWLLTVDNYLDGRHIPFIHPELHQSLDPEGYRYELFEYGNLQVGIARENEEAFELPRGHPDYGQRVGAYYFWLFPSTMLNFYPWGLSVNMVEPLGLDRTRTTFAYYVWDETKRGKGAGGPLDQVEAQDRAAMSRLQKGLRSPLFNRGPFSPKFDMAVHHCHRLIARFMA